jgi:hypothetical protein
MGHVIIHYFIPLSFVSQIFDYGLLHEKQCTEHRIHDGEARQVQHEALRNLGLLGERINGVS